MRRAPLSPARPPAVRQPGSGRLWGRRRALRRRGADGRRGHHDHGHLAADRAAAYRRRGRRADPPGAGHQDRQHLLQPAPRPASGAADLVVEELVEGGLTRLAVFFYSELADQDRAGPLDACQRHRDRRPGRAPPWSDQRRRRPHDRADPGRRHHVLPGGREGHLPRPVAQRAVQRVRRPHPASPRPTEAGAGPPRRLPAVGRGRRPAPGQAGHDASRRPSRAATRRLGLPRAAATPTSNTNAAADDQFPADTVLVLRVQVGDAGYLDPAGNPVPETKFEGTGAALLFHDGRDGPRHLVQGQPGRRPDAEPPRTGELSVPAGHTWIELVPAASGSRGRSSRGMMGA